jgi:hypothetical protein
MSMLLISSGFSLGVKTWIDNSPTHNITLGNTSIGLFNFSALDYNDTLIEDEDVFTITIPDFGYQENFSSYDSWGFYMNQTHEYFNGSNTFVVYTKNWGNESDAEGNFIFYINPLEDESNGTGLTTTLIDNTTTSLVNIVYYGFEITAGILDYIRINYVEVISGLIVLGILLGLIVAGSNSGSLDSIKSIFK